MHFILFAILSNFVGSWITTIFADYKFRTAKTYDGIVVHQVWEHGGAQKIKSAERTRLLEVGASAVACEILELVAVELL